MKHPFSSVWIIGAGKFGAMASERLVKKHPEARVTVVDHRAEALKPFEALPVEAVCHDGPSYLATHLDGHDDPDWVVPAIPVHLAFEWVRIKISMPRPFQVLPVPTDIEGMVLNPVRGREGQLFVSYADFVCPDNCSEPFDRCTFTGKPRKGLLYQTLERIVFEDFLSVVVRSRQLAPGVGGYRPEALRQALKDVAAHKGPVLFSTACLCHGVIHAVKIG
jgi:hypothetical protein